VEFGSANRIHAGIHPEGVVLATSHSFVEDDISSDT
jgi:hypothetical protein